EQAQQSVTQVLHGAANPAAARFLAAQLAYDLGRYGDAAEGFKNAADAGAKGPFADDAQFAAIEAMEAAGDDPGAAREWAKWEKQWPQSPLLPVARMREAWNMMRRGDAAGAQKTLAAVVAAQPWMAQDARFTLARATAAY